MTSEISLVRQSCWWPARRASARAAAAVAAVDGRSASGRGVARSRRWARSGWEKQDQEDTEFMIDLMGHLMMAGTPHAASSEAPTDPSRAGLHRWRSCPWRFGPAGGGADRRRDGPASARPSRRTPVGHRRSVAWQAGVGRQQVMVGCCVAIRMPSSWATSTGCARACRWRLPLGELKAEDRAASVALVEAHLAKLKSARAFCAAGGRRAGRCEGDAALVVAHAGARPGERSSPMPVAPVVQAPALSRCLRLRRSAAAGSPGEAGLRRRRSPAEPGHPPGGRCRSSQGPRGR